MRFRKLRIAWLVVWSMVAVLLCVLWVQSYWWFNHAQCFLSNNRAVALITVQGVVSIFGGSFDKPIPSGVTSRIGSKKITFETDYWKSDHWNFVFGEAFKEARAPLWFLVAMSGGISTLSWFPWLSRRSLLIATTVIAVVLGAMVWQSHH
jgi:hypothetical protein